MFSKFFNNNKSTFIMPSVAQVNESIGTCLPDYLYGCSCFSSGTGICTSCSRFAISNSLDKVPRRAAPVSANAPTFGYAFTLVPLAYANACDEIRLRGIDDLPDTFKDTTLISLGAAQANDAIRLRTVMMEDKRWSGMDEQGRLWLSSNRPLSPPLFA